MKYITTILGILFCSSTIDSLIVLNFINDFAVIHNRGSIIIYLPTIDVPKKLLIDQQKSMTSNIFVESKKHYN